MITIQEISDLLDRKLEPVYDRLDKIEARLDKIELRIDKLEISVSKLEASVSKLEINMEKVLSFVSVGNEDLTEKLPKKKLVKVHH